MLQACPSAVVFTNTGLGRAELIISAGDRGHGGERLAGDGAGIRIEGKPWRELAYQPGRVEAIKFGTSYRGLCMCCTVLLPFWLMAHLEQEGMDMGETALQGTAATGKNNVCGRLYA